jgi:hypothetical protein
MQRNSCKFGCYFVILHSEFEVLNYPKDNESSTQMINKKGVNDERRIFRFRHNTLPESLPVLGNAITNVW